MKFFVESNYGRDRVTAMIAKNGHVSQRAYNAAMKRVSAVAGDFLRLAACGDHDPGSVIIDGNDTDSGLFGLIQ